ncbi:hypothetical protein BBO99_00000143 [Phytophthora kernoviae]|uniref:Uncharacterized protein n=2 Tax=Phytophthora kernoviae TaxID=325452 RepID=A0A3R7FVZ7_9STRA|nr:hypothetical protein G195_001420 [Phytophthora kernoviae 00238/432]KAG2531475.1 hypothetical protein JM18_000397 [Phytophthora kernoviae]KAG2532649.1 hypothetical protein JM16_000289 [Phytophthora kernoviae]RLM96857.1 hypothetical protein BBI17_000245 [Phytophthora kernoviae]RLN85862.1 hypothetical protein BBO99_00000143 [Phytophthora kernoviae]
MDLAKLWKFVEGSEQSKAQQEAEKGIREAMDLINYLLYVRNRELEHQNELSETMGKMEKQLERKTHVVQTLATELETLKQNYAQQKNLFKAKEQALLSERKTLQTEKKALEVNCYKGKNLEGDAAELEKLASAPIDDFTPTPFNLATKQGLPKYITESMDVLDEKLKQLEHVILNEMPSAEARSDREVIKRLRKKLDDAHVIINEQDQLLQASLSSPAKDLRVARGKSSQNLASKTRGQRAGRDIYAPADDSPTASSLEELEREKRELATSRKNLENERQLLQEQAVKLDKDRLEFEISKQDQMFGSSKDSLLSSAGGRSPSIADSSSCSTPKRKRRAKMLDMGGPDSPYDIPVSATPGTAALLKKIGINVPTEK